jgi:trehalose 2-sulfotransferase
MTPVPSAPSRFGPDPLASVTVTAETGAGRPGGRRPDLSCLIATTPGSGSHLLCQALWETRLAGNPRDYFNPLKVVPRSVDWGLLGAGRDHLPRQPEQEFAGRYLNAVARAGTGPGGVFSARLPWSHQRWLARFARAAAPDVAETPSRSDTQVLERWYPRARYVYVTSADVAWQAGRWYLGRGTGPAATDGEPRPGQPVDFQEIRWIETLISRQQQAWEVYFRVNGVDAHRIRYEDFLAHPEETVGGILDWLGVPGTPARIWDGEDHRERVVRPMAWLSDYSAERDRLSAVIGVRQGQD